MFFISVTLDVSKFEISNDSNDVQNMKILFIFFTFWVLKLDKFKEDNVMHPSNNKDISLTSEVSKLFNSMLFNEIHPENI